MTSDKQIDANRRNAQLSTGPRTPQGKANSSRNALKHGLTSYEACLFGEDEAPFDDLAASLKAHFAPSDPLEQLLVQQMILAQWRIHRAVRFETGYLQVVVERCKPLNNPRVKDPWDLTLLFGDAVKDDTSSRDALSKLQRYENSARRAFFQALDQLNKHRRNPPSPPPQPVAPLAPPSENGFVSQNPPEPAS